MDLFFSQCCMILHVLHVIVFLHVLHVIVFKHVLHVIVFKHVLRVIVFLHVLHVIVFLHVLNVIVFKHKQGVCAVLQPMKSMEFRIAFSKVWKSMEFESVNQEVLKSHGILHLVHINSNCHEIHRFVTMYHHHVCHTCFLWKWHYQFW